MNFIFRPYPDHPWIADWTFEPRACKATLRENSPRHFFQALETVGRIAPSVAEPEWVLQVPVPQNSRINLLFNGFCAYFIQKKEKHGAEILTPEPGVLWGRTEGIPAVALASDFPAEHGEGFQWLDCDNTPALLAIRNGAFCLVTKSHLQNEALRIAQTYLDRDFETVLQQEFDKRANAAKLFEDMAHHDSLAVICAESMMKSLRPPEGSIPLSWCQASGTSVAQFDINEVFVVAQAWRLIDPAIAEELVTCALRIQNNAGAIPVLYAPHMTPSLMEAPKPLMAKTAEAVWAVRKNTDYLTAILPLLRRHLQWMLHHFDPKKKGIHCWKNSTECVVPEFYQTDLATVDLTVLLLTEIDALNRLRRQSSLYHADPETFTAEREQLEHNLLNQFWNENESAFTRAYLRDKEMNLRGFPAVTPLLWHNLSVAQKTAILDRIHESGTLPGGLSVLSWRKSAMDDASFPIMQQLLTFLALKQSDPNGSLLSDFARITIQGFVEWHTLSIGQDNRLQINPVMAAFIMNVQAIRQYRYHAQGGVTGYLFKIMRKARADRFDLVVIVATVFAVFSVHTIYNILKSPPPLTMLEAQMNSAYANKNAAETLENCYAIMRHYPDDSATARLLAGNISLLQGKYATASRLFEATRKEYPDSPGAMIGLGLAYQLQGRFNEAESSYYEFCYIFDEIFPALVDKVNTFRQLAQERFRSPPKWQEIYRYQIMHEL
jgi:tetratricopeptide (TPR) repeat protein